MKTVINTRKLQWHYFISTTATTASLLMLLASLALTLVPHPTISLLPLLLLALSLLALGMHQNNQWLRRPHAHITLDAALKTLDHTATLYHYYPRANHILVCTQGVFTLTPIPNPISLICKDDELHAQASLLTQSWQYILGNHPGKPVRTATADARRLQSYLHQHFPPNTLSVIPVITLANTNAHIVNPEALPIAYAYQDKRKPSLRTLIRQSPIMLTDAQIATINALLNPRANNAD